MGIQQGSLVQPNTQVPVLVDPATGTVQAPPGQPEGTLVVQELQAGGVLFTVPETTTFKGIIVLMVTGPTTGSATVTDAAGPTVVAEAGGCGASPLRPVIVPVTSAGGVGGNALTLADVSSGVVVSAVIAGYYA